MSAEGVKNKLTGNKTGTGTFNVSVLFNNLLIETMCSCSSDSPYKINVFACLYMYADVDTVIFICACLIIK